MERRFGYLCIFAGLATPNDVSVCFDEVEAGRNPLSPNLPLVMVRKGLLSDSEARAILHFLAIFERSPVDVEFSNLARDDGQLTDSDISAWEEEDEGESDLPSAPWPVKAIETGKMPIPAINRALDAQDQKTRGLRAELNIAVQKPPRSLIVPGWQTVTRRFFRRISQVSSTAYGVWKRPVFRRALAGLFIVVICTLAFEGYRRLQNSLGDVDAKVSLLRCKSCRNTVAWEGIKSIAMCPVCKDDDLYLLRRCAECFRIDESESVNADTPPNQACKVCKGQSWTAPYRFTKELTVK
ncbi:MAG: hypothetical protein QF473_32620 [Planctomycetota bacterium]|nr:hypothetical protein [Planctomycetota bacterium]